MRALVGLGLDVIPIRTCTLMHSSLTGSKLDAKHLGPFFRARNSVIYHTIVYINQENIQQDKSKEMLRAEN